MGPTTGRLNSWAADNLRCRVGDPSREFDRPLAAALVEGRPTLRAWTSGSFMIVDDYVDELEC